ncbi:autotransporter outer membrane beta-barrel domain-containing protein [Fusobacterium sp.]|uniref:autotransporter outer membrane beta-barrel domain-containing protein n=1 Tax=Fusobacterium sp. TaxID=68766 RepID=UPI000C70CB64|nr:autotransporter domain-containing protein [Fusobacterium sp.]
MMKKKKLLLLSLFIVCSNFTYSKDIATTAFIETNYLKLRETNKNKNYLFHIPEKHTVNIWKENSPIYDITEYIEKENLDLTNSSSNNIIFGLFAKGENTSILNEANMELTSNSVGLSGIQGAKIENGINGRLTLSGENQVGMLATSTISSINNGQINLSNAGNYKEAGMVSLNGAKSQNNGKITITGETSYGMLANSNNGNSSFSQTEIVNNKNGTINIKNSSNGYGMEAQEDNTFAINNGKITIENSLGSRGMVAAKGATAINEGSIILNNTDGSFAMNIGDGDSVNNNTTTIINKGDIIFDKDNKLSVGMRVVAENGYTMDSGLAINEENIEISGSDNIGMLGTGNNISLSNNNNITLKGDYNPIDTGVVANHNIGIHATNGAIGKNEEHGIITIDEGSQSSFAMVGINGSVRNEGKIILNSNEQARNVGMQIVGGVAENTGKILLNGNYQTGMTSANYNDIAGVAINKGSIIIEKGTTDALAMIGDSNSQIINNGYIVLNGSGVGMSNHLSTQTYVSIVNNKEIKLFENSIGINGTNKTNIRNEGNISITGDNNVGIKADQNSVVLNFGTITIDGKQNKGIYATGKSEVTTLKGSSINIIGNNNNGILLEDSKLTNEGNINITGDNNVGIKADQNSVVFNTGTITIDGKQNKGISILNGSKLENTGKIIIDKKEVDKVNTTDSNKNYGIYKDKNSQIVNKGTFSVLGDFNSNDMGEGQFIMEKNSTLEANKIKGDIHLASGITTGSLDNEYSTYKMFNTKEMEGNLISNSYLFDAKLSNNHNNYFDVILTRKNFKNIVRNNSIGNYLENNYVNTNNTNKITFYDKFKLASNQEQIDLLVNDTFGVKTFPTIEKQTFDVVRLNEDILQSNISKDSLKQDFGYIVGGAYNRIDSDTSSTTDGSMATLKNVWLGGEKKINNSLKYGLVFSIGDYDADFSNDSSRKDRMFQGTVFLNYDKNDINARTFLTIGGTKTRLERDLKSYSERLKSSFDSRYIVWTNEVSKKINTPYNSYLIPKIGFKLYKLSQDKIKEDGQFGIDLDKVDKVIMEPSVGFTLGKNISLKNDYTLIPEIEMNYIYRAGDLKDNLTGKIESISNDQFELEGYKFKRNTGNMKIKLGLNKNDWTLFGSYRVMFEKKIDSIGTVGINYKFN